MRLVFNIANLLFLIMLILACRSTNITAGYESVNIDTLKVRHFDTYMLGRQLFPSEVDLKLINNLIDQEILLVFESGRHIFMFYNRNKKPNYLSTSYWNEQVCLTLNRYFYSRNNVNKLNRVDYLDGPYLTGFYGKTDSILVHTSDIKRFESKISNKIYVNYFSTKKTSFKLGNICIGITSNDLLSKLGGAQIKDLGTRKGIYYLIIMQATTKLNNAWFANYPNLLNDDTNAIIFTLKDNKLARIEFCDFESAEHLFRKEIVNTNKIHY